MTHSHSLLLLSWTAPLVQEISVSDSITFADTIALTAENAYADSVILTDAAYPEPIATDVILFVDVAYRAQNEISLDDAALPHVQSISIQEPSIVQDLPIMDRLPYRKQRGKQGRQLTISGWTDSLSTIETLRGYSDGEKHLLVLPTGDSLQVHVTDVLTPETVENYKTYEYTLVMVEAVD
jgi:hypothetical protein